MGWIFAATCVVLARAIWTRRWTFRAVSERTKLTERTITSSLLLQFIALVLMSPLSSATVGRSVHAAIGQWNIPTWVGHCLFIDAAGLIVIYLKSRLDYTDDQIRIWFTRHFALPITAIAPIMLALITQSPNADKYWADLLDCPTDYWLDAYWTLGCSFVIYLMAHAIWVLHTLREEPRNKRTAAVYICACAAVITGSVLRITTTWTDDGTCSHWFWYAYSTVAITFAEASAHSWRQKVRRMTRPLS